MINSVSAEKTVCQFSFLLKVDIMKVLDKNIIMSELHSTLSAKEKPKTKKDNSNKARPKGIFSCKYCESEFTQKTNLYRHIRHLHKRRGDLPTLDKYICSSCKEEFKSQTLLSFHQALIHPVRKGKLVITCPICPFSGSKGELLGHYVAEHNVKVDIEEHNFPSALEFLVWKSNVERDTLTQYAKRQKHHVLVNGVIIDMLYCHRDGFYRPEGKNLRNLKLKGTNKINGYCPAFMKVMTFADDRVSVLFLKTHVGHGYELDRLTLTREERDSIAAKIAIGISFDEILAELHSSEHERLRIMTRKDLYNIETSYHLNSGTVRGRHSKAEGIIEQHSAAFKIPRCFVTMEGDYWNVKSTSNNDVVYKVELINTHCDYDQCPLKCTLCLCCGHNYKCSCEDYQKISTMCKHKHVVHLTRKEPDVIMQADCIGNNECANSEDLQVQENVPSSSVTNTNLAPSIMLDNCPQLTTLVIQDLPSTVSNDTTTIFVSSNINARKAAIRTQLAGILQAVETSVLEEELHLIQSLLEPIVESVQSMKDSEEIIVPEIIEPVCKQLRLDDDTASYFASADTSTSLIPANQLQPTIVDEHNNPILITYTLNQPSQ